MSVRRPSQRDELHGGHRAVVAQLGRLHCRRSGAHSATVAVLGESEWAPPRLCFTERGSERGSEGTEWAPPRLCFTERGSDGS